MKITPSNDVKTIRKHQQGGEMEAAPAPAPAQGGQQDPLMQILQLAQQALQTQDCNAAMAVCDGLMQLASQGQEAPAEEVAPEGEPVYRKGGKLSRRI